MLKPKNVVEVPRPGMFDLPARGPEPQSRRRMPRLRARVRRLLGRRRRARSWVAWVETLGLAACTLLAGQVVQPQDPLFLRDGFSWTSLAPVLAGLRYGFVHGLCCAVVMVLGVGAAVRLGVHGSGGFPGQLGFGLLALGMISGEFRDLWERRLVKERDARHHARSRLDELTRVFHLLKRSHEKLERQLAGSAPSVRELLLGLREKALAARNAGEPLQGLGGALLELIASHGVHAACAFEVDERGQVAMAPAARLGALPPPVPEDPLLKEAVAKGRCVRVHERDEVEGTSLLAAVPLVDVEERVWGVVAIQEMRFDAFQDDTLRLLALMGAHVGDLLSTARRAEGAPAGERFVLQLERALHDLSDHGVPAAVVGVCLEPGPAEQLLEPLREERRGLDAQWLAGVPGGGWVLRVLMPLADPEEVDGFVARLDRLARNHVNAGLEELRIAVRVRVLREGDTAADVLAALSGGEGNDEVDGLDGCDAAAGGGELGNHARG